MFVCLCIWMLLDIKITCGIKSKARWHLVYRIYWHLNFNTVPQCHCKKLDVILLYNQMIRLLILCPTDDTGLSQMKKEIAHCQFVHFSSKILTFCYDHSEPLPEYGNEWACAVGYRASSIPKPPFEWNSTE